MRWPGLPAEFRGAVAERAPVGRAAAEILGGVFEGAAAEATLEGDEAKAKALIGEAIETAAVTPQAAGPRASGRRRSGRSRASRP